MDVALVANKLATLTLAGLLSLSQWFSDGTTALGKKDYAAATTSFTKVIDSNVDDNPFLEPALYFRAHCYAVATKTKNAAVADLTRLLKINPDNGLADLAKADFKKLTGKAWDGIDLSTPAKSWKSLVRAIRKQDIKGVTACCTGEMREEFLEAIEDEDDWAEIVQEIANFKLTRLVYNKDKSKALVFFRDPDGDEESAIMHREGKHWRLAEEGHSAGDEFDVSKAKKPVDIDAIKLKEAEKHDIDRVIKLLGDRDAAKRKAAYRRLKALGAKAAPQLIKASRDPDPEISAQAKALLDDL